MIMIMIIMTAGTAAFPMSGWLSICWNQLKIQHNTFNIKQAPNTHEYPNSFDFHALGSLKSPLLG